MQIDFYQYASPISPVFEFGLVDPDDKNGKKPVFVSYDKNADKWNATVICNNRSDYSFIPVDNNIPLVKKINGRNETASVCDAMLYSTKTVCFIELKADKKGNNWLSKAVEQLSKTIEFFGEELKKYEHKRAYVCNTRRPFTATSHKIVQQQFIQKNKVLLRINTTIKELK